MASNERSFLQSVGQRLQEWTISGYEHIVLPRLYRRNLQLDLRFIVRRRRSLNPALRISQFVALRVLVVFSDDLSMDRDLHGSHDGLTAD